MYLIYVPNCFTSSKSVQDVPVPCSYHLVGSFFVFLYVCLLHDFILFLHSYQAACFGWGSPLLLASLPTHADLITYILKFLCICFGYFPLAFKWWWECQLKFFKTIKLTFDRVCVFCRFELLVDDSSHFLELWRSKILVASSSVNLLSIIVFLCFVMCSCILVFLSGCMQGNPASKLFCKLIVNVEW